MLAEVIFRRSARSVSEQSEETLIAPTATLVAVMVRNPRRSINFALSSTGILFADSVVKSLAGVVTLENDLPTPPSQQYYGTDATGARGYHNLPVSPTQGGSYLISGGGVVWSGTGYLFHVSAAVYVINGVQFASPATDITLDPSDPTFDRIDVVAVDNTNAVVLIDGVAAASPVEPQIDPATQLKLTFIYVPAASTAPPLTTVDIYHENAEWTTTVVGAPINPASTNNPHSGTKDVEATAAVSGNTITLAKPSGTLKPSDYASLSFWIRSKASWPTPKALSIYWSASTGPAITNVGTVVTLKNGAYGFDSSNITSYQLIVIPTSAFNTGGTSVDRLIIAVSGGGGPIGWYLDDIILQSGGGGPPPVGGDFSTNTNVSVAGEVVVFADTTGKLGKRGTEGTDFLGPARISDAAYDATTWNADTTHAPSKNAVRDKIESLTTGGEVPLTFADSLNRVVNTINLDGDNNTPGNSKYYGTDGAGAKGFFALPVVSAGSIVRNFSFSFKKTAGLATGKIAGYWTCPFAGTITAWNLTVDVGTITVKIWKKATGTVHPTTADSITASGLALTTGTNLHSTSLGGFSTLAVAIGDVFACEISAVGGGVTEFGGSVEITT